MPSCKTRVFFIGRNPPEIELRRERSLRRFASCRRPWLYEIQPAVDLPMPESDARLDVYRRLQLRVALRRNLDGDGVPAPGARSVHGSEESHAAVLGSKSANIGRRWCIIATSAVHRASCIMSQTSSEII